MTKRETDEVIMAACRDISDEYFRTYKEGKQILMQLPIPYDDNDFPVLVINPYYDGSGFIHIDDMGETSFHQMLTESELDELCEAHDLSHGNIYGRWAGICVGQRRGSTQRRIDDTEC